MDILPKTRNVEAGPDESVVYTEYKAARSIDTRAAEAKDRDDEVVYTEYRTNSFGDVRL